MVGTYTGGGSDFYDAPALVKLVVREEGSETLREHFDNSTSLAYTNPVCLTEALGALKGKRKRNELSSDDYFTAAYVLLAYVRGRKILLHQLDLGELQVYDEAEAVAERHELDLADALQIVTLNTGLLGRSIRGSKPVLITADGPLTNAAKAEGLATWNVLTEPKPVR